MSQHVLRRLAGQTLLYPVLLTQQEVWQMRLLLKKNTIATWKYSPVKNLETHIYCSFFLLSLKAMLCELFTNSIWMLQIFQLCLLLCYMFIQINAKKMYLFVKYLVHIQHKNNVQIKVFGHINDFYDIFVCINMTCNA